MARAWHVPSLAAFSLQVIANCLRPSAVEPNGVTFTLAQPGSSKIAIAKPACFMLEI
jgi:hypothetical protein